MKVTQEVKTWGKYPQRYNEPRYGPNEGLVTGLVYMSGIDLPFGEQTMRRGWDVGVLAPLNRYGKPALSSYMEIRHHELAAFCRTFLAEYDQVDEWDK